MNVLVTGGSRGIGAKIVEIFAKSGFNVVINYNSNLEYAKSLSEKLNSEGYNTTTYKADVSDIKQVKEMVLFCKNTYGSIDILVNNAGIAQTKLFDEIEQDDWDKMININLKGVYNCSREVVKDMIKSKKGSIINISSMWGITGASCEVHYSASKAGIIGLTKALAKELGPSNIRVNCVAPGVIKTDMLNEYSEEDIKALEQETPLLRLGKPEDIANAVFFLASENASFITGEVINVNGGFLI